MVELKRGHKITAHKRTKWDPCILTGRQLRIIIVPLLHCDNISDLYNMAQQSPCTSLPRQNKGLLLHFIHLPLHSSVQQMGEESAFLHPSRNSLNHIASHKYLTAGYI